MILIQIILSSTFSWGAIWGADSTQHIWQTSSRDQTIAQSVAHLIPKNFVTTNPDGTKNIEAFPLSETWSLCSSEPWAKNLSMFVGCTGFLIGPDRLMTAGHCMINHGRTAREATPLCQDFIWVFDFQENAAGILQTQNLPADRFAECAEVIEAVHDSEENRQTNELTLKDDYAVLNLKSPVARPFLKLAAQDPKGPAQLSMFGHPLGGPLRRSEGRILSENEKYWVTNLDSFPGNSGSPVLSTNGDVIGILVRGYPESTFTPKGQQCAQINRCTENTLKCEFENKKYPYGEHVQKLPRKLLESL